MSPRNSVRASTPVRFTALETRIMTALSGELRGVVPDLAAQFDRASPGLRRNTAFGYYSGITPGAGPSQVSGATGRFGTVHAMLAGMSEAVLFQVEMIDGRLIALHADSYGQDTRALDISNAQINELFTVDGQGRSIPLDLPQTAPERARQTAHQAAAPRPVQPTGASPSAMAARPSPVRTADTGSARRFGDAARPPRETTPTVSRTPPPSRSTPAPQTSREAPEEPTSDGQENLSLLIGLWAVIGAVGLLAVLLADAPVFGVVVFAILLGRAVRQPKVLSVIAAGLKKAQEHQAALQARKS